jgi:hypothetical protein
MDVDSAAELSHRGLLATDTRATAAPSQTLMRVSHGWLTGQLNVNSML